MKGSYYEIDILFQNKRSFQQALMAGGIARQLSFCTNTTITVDINPPPTPKPQWCDDVALVQGLEAAQTRLWHSIQGAPNSEFLIYPSVELD